MPAAKNERTKKQTLEYLRELKPELKRLYGINEIAVFGSFARDNEPEYNDIDIIIIDMDRKNGFLIAKAKRYLTEKLNKNVDIGFYSVMNPYIKKNIQEDIIHV
ncbi:nucleotidyltransferase family protein [Flexistipes sp.]|uniref:nucleotidyltransferase family protein n=1 Tax=Flexistipes sp. TaxID=3088135 RepID=UPI002E1DB7D5|nr:nucleotidyltransferase domain-containing protein [Flexistipes sp.]